ncbi:hypothetical protein COO60DRAFT_1084068 [Scenedesmus sp. NREL 46B-D3]|nr:hypothetical protein COO60DRAFT_1084068 [Scenedesmus sp. NREL 46B-D3]
MAGLAASHRCLLRNTTPAVVCASVVALITLCCKAAMQISCRWSCGAREPHAAVPRTTALMCCALEVLLKLQSVHVCGVCMLPWASTGRHCTTCQCHTLAHVFINDQCLLTHSDQNNHSMIGEAAGTYGGYHCEGVLPAAFLHSLPSRRLVCSACIAQRC